MVRALLRFTLIEGLGVSALIALAVTFGFHLVNGLMPSAPGGQHSTQPPRPIQPIEDESPVVRLRTLMRQDAHTLWLRGRNVSRTAVAGTLMRAYMIRDAGSLGTAGDSVLATTERSVMSSYAAWVLGLLRFQLGTSRSGISIGKELAQKAPLTFRLAMVAYLASLLIGTALALVRRARDESLVVQILHSGTTLLTALPAFFLGYVLIAVFRLDLSENPSLLPALVTMTLSGGIISEMDRVVHKAVGRQMSANFITTAVVKGLKGSSIAPVPGTVAFHAFREALTEFLPRLATRAPMVVGMTMLVEKVFVLPGLGDMLVDGLAYRDEPRVLAVVLIIVVIVRLCTLVTRAGNVLLNPRAVGVSPVEP